MDYVKVKASTSLVVFTGLYRPGEDNTRPMEDAVRGASGYEGPPCEGLQWQPWGKTGKAVAVNYGCAIFPGGGPYNQP